MDITSRRHRVVLQSTLLGGWCPVIRVRYEQLFSNGSMEMQERDVNARADGVTILLHSADRQSVVLLRQPRIVATLRGDASGETLEACSGMLEEEPPAECALREIREETGLEVRDLMPVASVYASPGASLEMIHLFTAEFTGFHLGPGGGLRSEGEDIELLEVPLPEALRMMRDGVIRDARTMLLLQHLALENKADAAETRS